MISFQNHTQLTISLAHLHTQHKRWQPKENPVTSRPAYRSLAFQNFVAMRIFIGVYLFHVLLWQIRALLPIATNQGI